MHWKAYREGKITLKQARRLQLLKISKSKNARREYKLQEKLLHIDN